MNEFELIRQYFCDASGDAELGIGDDAALISPPAGVPLAIAVDTSIEGTHFLDKTPAAAIGHRALAVNLSDLAAMGARPKYFTLALTLPTAEPDWLRAFSGGLFALARKHGVQLIGGDTTRGALSITIQVIGYQYAPAMRRAAAKPGDQVLVSGTLGDAAGGLRLSARDDTSSENEDWHWLTARYQYPTPRVSLGEQLAGTAHAAIDISDGLLADLEHVCAASGCGADIDTERLPISRQLRGMFTDTEALEFALNGGDDYELCFTLPADVDAAQWPQCTAIGVIREGDGVSLHGSGSHLAAKRGGYQHFQ